MLARFERRADVRRASDELADTGVAGADLYFRFYWLTAIWLVERGLGPQLTIDWDSFENAEKLTDTWHLLLPFTETAALDCAALSPRDWVMRMKAPFETDAEFVIRRFEALNVPVQVREKLYEDLDIPMILSTGPMTPARGRERWEAPVVFIDEPPDATRPDLAKVIHTARPRIRAVSRREGRKLIDLANACMVPRHRDLLIFLYADDRDVRLVDCGGGLQFACMGATPERRLVLEAVYGFLTILNGVPIGYVLLSSLYGSCEVAYNVFETFRGRGAAQVYGQVLALAHQLFGATSFAVDPYQLGHGNKEGQDSGAWWFYYKLGFRPHDARVRRLVRGELKRMERNPRHRTPVARLDDLASEYMFLQLGRERSDVLGELPLGDIGLAIQSYMAERFGADREGGLEVCAAEASELLGLRDPSKLSRGERLAFSRWAPVALALPGVERWSTSERRALLEVIRAKGGERESDFVRSFDRHAKLRRALLRLAN
jgi:hypothetical protein